MVKVYSMQSCPWAFEAENCEEKIQSRSSRWAVLIASWYNPVHADAAERAEANIEKNFATYICFKIKPGLTQFILCTVKENDIGEGRGNSCSTRKIKIAPPKQTVPLLAHTSQRILCCNHPFQILNGREHVSKVKERAGYSYPAPISPRVLGRRGRQLLQPFSVDSKRKGRREGEQEQGQLNVTIPG